MVDRHDAGETNLRTFNTAKKFSEEILFPLMEDCKKYQRMMDFGSSTIEDATSMPEDIREINRYNGAKCYGETTLSLLNAIKSTVILHNNKEEIIMTKEIDDTLEKLKYIFYDDKDKFFIKVFRGTKEVEVLDRRYFEKIKKIIITCYINVEILMTRNKLLFADSKDEFATDEDIREQIMKEYIEG